MRLGLVDQQGLPGQLDEAGLAHAHSPEEVLEMRALLRDGEPHVGRSRRRSIRIQEGGHVAESDRAEVLGAGCHERQAGPMVHAEIPFEDHDEVVPGVRVAGLQERAVPAVYGGLAPVVGPDDRAVDRER